MVVKYVRYALTKHSGAELESACKRATERREASPHARAWELSACHEDPSRYILRIERDGAERHMQEFRRGLRFAHFRPFVEEVEEMRHCRPTSIASKAEEAAAHA